MKTESISSAVTGSDNPEPVEVAIAIPGEYPDEFLESPEAWKAAFDHAAKHKNTPKACVLFAEAHSSDFEDREPEENVGALKARIAELEAEAAKPKTRAKKTT